MSQSLHALVLGAAAGGGLPQWNCGCRNCNEARRPGGKVPPQSQSSLAASANGTDWVIFNTSPDIRDQIAANPALHPKDVRHTPIASVVLTNGDIDHIAGLLVLREKQRLQVFLTGEIHRIIQGNPVFDALDRDFVTFRTIAPGEPCEVAPGLRIELFPVPGKVPLYMEGEEVETDLVGEQTVGVEIAANGRTVFYVPGCARLAPDLADRLRNAGLVFFDGTVFQDTEMRDTGTGVKTGARMGHMAMSGENGSIGGFSDLGVARKIYVHINNTNPVWWPDSPERRMVEDAGWEIGHDGMQVTL